MKKITVLIYLCGGLIILNLILLFFILQKPGNPLLPEHRAIHAEELLVNELHLDEQQISLFRILRKKHQLQNEQINRKIQIAYDSLFLLLQEPEIIERKKIVLFETIENHTSALNESNFEHFLSLKSILRSDQIAFFNQFTNQLRNKFGPQEGHGLKPQPYPG